MCVYIYTYYHPSHIWTWIYIYYIYFYACVWILLGGKNTGKKKDSHFGREKK